MPNIRCIFRHTLICWQLFIILRLELGLSVRASMADYKKEDSLLNLPLYAIENIIDQGNDMGK